MSKDIIVILKRSAIRFNRLIIFAKYAKRMNRKGNNAEESKEKEKEKVQAKNSLPVLRESGPPITPASLGPGWPESAPS